jgi:hypothetical protein
MSLIAVKSLYTLFWESLFTCVRVEVQSPQGITDEQMLLDLFALLGLFDLKTVNEKWAQWV